MSSLTPIIYEYEIDLASNNNFFFVKAVQGDGEHTRIVRLYLNYNGTPYKLDTNIATIAVRGTKPDGNQVMNNCTLINDNTVEFELTSQMLAVSGKSSYDIVLIDNGEDNVLTSFPFTLMITKAAIDASSVISSNEFSLLTSKINEVGILSKELNDTISDCESRLEIAESNAESATAEANEKAALAQKVVDDYNALGVDQIIEDTKQATEDANNAKDNANTFVTNSQEVINEAVENAKEATDAANVAAANANDAAKNIADNLGINDDLENVSTTSVWSSSFTKEQIDALDNSKVDKEDGKTLSTNDYTTEEKEKLENIETGAQVNQNAFSKVAFDSYSWSADSSSDTLPIISGNNITFGVTPDGLAIGAIDTTYTLEDFNITASSDEINNCVGTTSNIQEQLDNKSNLDHVHDYLPLTGGNLSGDVTFGNENKINVLDSNGNSFEILRMTDENILCIGDGLYVANSSKDVESGYRLHLNAGSVVSLVTPYDRLILEPDTEDATQETGGVRHAIIHPYYNGRCKLGSDSHQWKALYAKDINCNYVTANNTITAKTITQTSDIREKENIIPFGTNSVTTLSLDEENNQSVDIHSELFDRLQPVQYNMIDGNGKICYGFIAQQIVLAMEELGYNENDLDLIYHDYWKDGKTGEEKETYRMAYSNFIAMLVYETQKLKAKTATLESEINYLKEEIASLKNN